MGAPSGKYAVASAIAKEKYDKDIRADAIKQLMLSPLDDLIKEEGRIRRSRREAVYAREERNRQIRDYTIIGITSLIGLSAVGWMIWIISVSL